MRKIIEILKNNIKNEKGPLAKRHSYVLFQRWLTHASATAMDGTVATPVQILPLELIDPADTKQVEMLVGLLSQQRQVISFFVRHHGAQFVHHLA